jgi:hypothetical protein
MPYPDDDNHTACGEIESCHHLQKDPARRFQSPAELLKAIPAITGAIHARRRVTRQSLQKMPSFTSRVGTRKPLARPGPKKISVARLPVTGSDVFGREELNSTVLRIWYLVGPSIGRAPAAAFRPQTNLLTLPLLGLACIQNRDALWRRQV